MRNPLCYAVQLLGVSALRLSAAMVAQCEVSDGTVLADTDGAVLAWNTLGGGTAWVPWAEESDAWAYPVLAAEGVVFDGAAVPASPLIPTASEVSTLFLAVNPDPGLEDRFSTLVEIPGASVSAVPGVLPRTYDPDDAAGLALRVNGGSLPEFPDAPHIVEVDFATPVAGGDLRVGGATVCAAWRQMWRGSVGAVIAFDAAPDEDIRRVVRNYLSRRMSIAGDFPEPGHDAVTRAMALGLNTHGLFATVLFVK